MIHLISKAMKNEVRSRLDFSPIACILTRPVFVDIHAVMIQDKVRTSSYASFILTNPYLFRDAVVLDVGCGTGILSLFAARGGAKRVFAVDASDIAEKAAKIVKVNSLDDVITYVYSSSHRGTVPA